VPRTVPKTTIATNHMIIGNGSKGLLSIDDCESRAYSKKGFAPDEGRPRPPRSPPPPPPAPRRMPQSHSVSFHVPDAMAPIHPPPGSPHARTPEEHRPRVPRSKPARVGTMGAKRARAQPARQTRPAARPSKKAVGNRARVSYSATIAQCEQSASRSGDRHGAPPS